MLSAVARLMLDHLPPGDGSALLWNAGEPALARELSSRRGELLVVEDLPLEPAHPSMDESGPACLHAAYPPDGAYETILLTMDRDRELSRHQIGWAASVLSPGGSLLFGGANREGVKSYRKALEGLFGVVNAEIGGHSRLWICSGPVEPRKPVETRPAVGYEIDGLGPVYTLPGVFGRRGLDRGTETLLGQLPLEWDDWRVCDLGCGTGVLALRAALGNAARVVALDGSARALECARATLAGRPEVEIGVWSLGRPIGERFDAVLCNPPFHSSGRHALSLVTGFIEAARGALVDGGELWLVTRRELPVEDLLVDGFTQTDLIDAANGYLVVRAVAGKTTDDRDAEGEADDETQRYRFR